MAGTPTPGTERARGISSAINPAVYAKPHIKLRNDGSFTVSGVNGPLDFFGPQQPLVPLAQDQAVGRQFDYPVGYNTRTIPRGEEVVSFSTLRALADGYDVLRLIIETRKDQVAGAKFTIGHKDERKKRDPRCDMLEEFWQSPDKVNSWADWVRMLLEQMFVYDAPALYCKPNRGGDLHALEILDGALIKRVITEDGRAPLPDEGPAYQQILKGLPAVDYSGLRPYKDVGEAGGMLPELLYKPRNPRVDRFYGYSPVEQVITTVNISLRRQLYQLNYYTDGSTPDLIFQVPDTWQPDQIAKFSAWWQEQLRGNLETRRGTMFVPKGVVPTDTKEKALKDEYDEWLIRICCFAFSISPTPFIKQMNRATAQSHHEQSIQEGLEPVQRWISDLASVIHTYKFGMPDLVMRWEEDEAIDPLEQATIFGMYVDKKILHPDEVRQKLGEDPMTPDMRDQMDLATFNAAANSTVLPAEQQAARDAQAVTLAAAKPAPIMPAKPTEAEMSSQKAHELAVAEAGKPLIKVDVAPPAITVEQAAVNVTTAPVNVTLPEIKQADVYVDVGGTTVQAKFDAPRNGTGKTVTATKNPDGTFSGTISDGVTRVVSGKKDPDGNTIVKIED